MTHPRPTARLAALCLLLACAAGALPASAAPAAGFFTPPEDPGAKLPAQGIYPQGRRMAFMGYSGKPESDLDQGFSVAGPVYGNQDPYLEKCFAHHWPVVAQVDGGARFLPHNGAPPPPLDLAQAEAKAKDIVTRLAGHDEIIWWAINPEELRPWKKDEMAYLQRMCKAIRAADPKKRPVFLYNPNNRDAKTLEPVAKQVDILGKGAYIDPRTDNDRKNHRAWIRWGIEQEVEAGKKVGHPVTPILMPWMAGDPADPKEDAMIEPWCRHDVYLGLCSGAKGVLIWSLAKRKGFERTHDLWRDAYARCGSELGGERNLGEVFLFGVPKNDLKVAPTDAGAAGTVALGGHEESNTTSAAERQERSAAVPDFTVCERAFGPRRYLFVVNSRVAPRTFSAAGWPAGTRFSDAFTGKPLAADQAASFTLPAWGVAGIVAEAPASH